MMKRIFCCILSIGSLLAGVVWSDNYVSDEGRLHDQLLKKQTYLRSVRPVAKGADVIQVKFGVTVVSIDNLDEEAETLHTHVWLFLHWEDAQLTWNPADFGNISSTRLEIDDIWVPNIHTFNGRSSGNILERKIAMVDYNGRILYFLPINLVTYCGLDLTRFPYDTQTCKLMFGSGTYDGTKVNLTKLSDAIFSSASIQPSPFFELVDHKFERHAIALNCCADVSTHMTITLVLKRRAGLMTHVMVAPSVVMALLLPVIFLLPPESKEKLVLGIGLLISDAILFLSITTAMRSGHFTVPLIAVYHLVNMTMVCISMAISALVMNIWMKGQRGKLLPSWISVCIVRPLSRILCVPKEDIMTDGANGLRQMDGLEAGDTDPIVTSWGLSATAVEWRQLAVVIDRLCFLVFVVIVFLCVIVFGSK